MISSPGTKLDLPQAPHPTSPAKATASGAPWIEEAGVPRWRKLVAAALVGSAFVVGFCGLAVYGFMIWMNPPTISSPMRHTSSLLTFTYIVLPLLVLFSPVWGASRLAKRIDPSRPDD